MDTMAVKKIVDAAISDLYDKDGAILKKEHDIRESTITHRLALYLEEYFKQDGYVVDIEYSKVKHWPQGNEDARALITKKLSGSPSDGEANTIYPDIIVHKRDSRDNLIEIEVSIAWRDTEKLYNLKKVNEYMKSLRYEHGIYIELTERKEDAKAYFGPFNL